MARRALIPSLCAACLAAGHAAHAEEPESWPLSEAIEVDEGQCITRAELLPSIETWLGRNAIDRRVRIVVDEIEPGRPRFVVTRDGKPSAERRFKPTEIACADLRAAVALAIALAIDATILQALLEPAEPVEESEPERKEPPPAEVKTPRRTPPPRPAPPAVPPRRRDPVAGEAAAGVWLGVLPVPAFGGLLGVSIPLGPIALRAAGFAIAAQASVGDGDADVALAAGELGVCLASSLSPLTLRGCAGGAAGVVSATGSGFAVNRATALPWVATVAGLGAELPLGQAVSIAGRIAGYLPLARPSLEVNAPDGTAIDRETLPPAGVALTLGIRVEFP